MTPDILASEKAAIAELIARYNFVIDHNDFQGWADCFTPDGVFDGMIGRFAAQSYRQKRHPEYRSQRMRGTELSTTVALLISSGVVRWNSAG